MTGTTSHFTLTYDYLCPFARNANEHVAVALAAGAPWQVRFAPFSLAQSHIGEGEPAVWDRPDARRRSGLLALAVGMSVQALAPDAFLAAHVELFAARHDHGRDLRDEAVLVDALERAGVDPAPVIARALQEGIVEVAEAHQRMVSDHAVWGVPTFIGSHRAAFVRVLDRPEGDGAAATRRVARVLELLDGEPELHEFKQVDLPR